jgi:hypothetical protein
LDQPRQTEAQIETTPQHQPSEEEPMKRKIALALGLVAVVEAALHLLDTWCDKGEDDESEE